MQLRLPQCGRRQIKLSDFRWSNHNNYKGQKVITLPTFLVQRESENSASIKIRALKILLVDSERFGEVGKTFQRLLERNTKSDKPS